jgi:hypothetical protein
MGYGLLDARPLNSFAICSTWFKVVSDGCRIPFALHQSRARRQFAFFGGIISVKSLHFELNNASYLIHAVEYDAI